MRRRHSTALTRRNFLGQTAAATVALGLGACGHDSEPTAPPEERIPAAAPGERILIVGGGLAGLRVLDRLHAAGKTVQLFEASNSPGGRVRTVRRGLPEGLWAEAGAERFAEGHKHLQALLRELGLNTVQYPPGGSEFILRVDGRFHSWRKLGDLPEELRASLKGPERETRFFHMHWAHCREDQKVSPDDERTGLQWLRDQGLSAAGERFANAFCFLPLARMCAHDFWRDTLRDRKLHARQTIEGGVDKITTRLAERHRARIVTGAEVRTLVMKEGEMILRETTGREHRGDLVVLALPLGPLLGLDFQPARPELIRRWTAGLATAREVKYHLTYKDADLTDRDISPHLMGFDFPRMTWPSPGVSPDGQRVLNAMGIREDLEMLDTLARGSPDVVRRIMAVRLPQITSFGPRVFSHDFNKDPLIRGSYTYRTPGAPSPPKAMREGCLVLAGADFSTHPGWMEGALESAENAVKEILAS